MDLPGLGEFGFLERLRARVPVSGAALGIGDDAAVLDLSPGTSLVAATDVVVEGIHAKLGWSSPADIGWKSVAVSVSDIAAMGAEPRWLLVGLTVPPGMSLDDVDSLYDGVLDACATWGLELVGGDTVSAPVLAVAGTVLGELDGPPLVRSGVRPGDVLAVTGPLGLAAAGLRLLLHGAVASAPDERACLAAHRRPRPRVEEAGVLRRSRAVTACLDVSDGLLSDVRRLCEASGVGVEIDADAVPVADEVRRTAGSRGWNPLELALSGGEDLELLIALDPARLPDAGVPVHLIGRAIPEGLWLVSGTDRRPLPEGGWDHFRPPR